MPKDPIDLYQNKHFVYVGRPTGRKNALGALCVAKVPFRAYAKPAEYAAYPDVHVEPPPDQPSRATFYARQMASLVLADAKHKRLGWRTGRAYHAVLAGCPAVVEADHVALAVDFISYHQAAELHDLHKALRSPVYRRRAWAPQSTAILRQLQAAEDVAAELGL